MIAFSQTMLPLFKVFMSDEAVHNCTSVLKSGYIGQGDYVDKFESSLAKFFGVDSLCTVNSGTSALHLAIHLLKKPFSYIGANDLPVTWKGLQDGDEVITTALTCTATNWPILANNLNIKWADIDPKTLNIDLEDVASKITSKTKIIMVVHWGGAPVNLDRLSEILDDTEATYGFRPQVIEDCAHAFGSTYKGSSVGSSGNFCTFSFQAIKHLTSVDGGLLVLPRSIQSLLARAKLVRWYGIDRDTPRSDFRCEADIQEWGFKFHMNDVNASIGLANLNNIQPIIAAHKSNASFYDIQLSNIDGIEIPDRLNNTSSASWIYSVLVKDKPNFYRAMQSRGVATSQVHKRNDFHSCVSQYRVDLPALDQIEPRLSAIPVGWWISDENRQYIVDQIKLGW